MASYKIKYAAAAARGLDAEVVGATMEKIVARDGGLTPHAVVLEAKPKRHPLHDFFLWDDAAAGAAYREKQAGYLIRAVVRVEDDSPREVRAFVSIDAERTEDDEDPGRAIYQPIQVVMADPDMREMVLHRALMELDAWKRKYRDLEELVDVVRAAEAAMVMHGEEVAEAQAGLG
jgi:hypothetical protein